MKVVTYISFYFAVMLIFLLPGCMPKNYDSYMSKKTAIKKISIVHDDVVFDGIKIALLIQKNNGKTRVVDDYVGVYQYRRFTINVENGTLTGDRISFKDIEKKVYITVQHKRYPQITTCDSLHIGDSDE